MCELYGALSYRRKIKDISEITEALAVESAVRGTDATGIAYNHKGKLSVFKKSKSAYEIDFSVPKGVYAVMGHTRHATQGTLKFNGNNHPFKGICGGKEFALAHNGILSNDNILRRELKLPKTKIETDSYISVQLLESRNRFDFDSIKYMAETVEGSFSFSILDDRNNLYLIKGDSPLTIFHFYDKGAYVYASTTSILWKALVDTELFMDLRGGNYEEIDIREGEILKISQSGQTKKQKFQYDELSGFGLDWRRGYGFDYEDDYCEELRNVAPYLGYDREEVDFMLREGYTPEEIEELFYGAYEEV